MTVRPGRGDGGGPEVVVRALQLTGNDMGPLHWTATRDLGKTWMPPWESMTLLGEPAGDSVFEKIHVMPHDHAPTGTMLGLGRTYFTRDTGSDPMQKDETHIYGRPGGAVYAVWNDGRGDWEPWRRLELPRDDHKGTLFRFGGAAQAHVCEDGTILKPTVRHHSDGRTYVGAVRLAFDGETVTVVEVGDVVGEATPGGICEPSMVAFGGRYLMTIRSEYGVPENNHDGRMYHAVSDDGVEWKDFAPWRWDDGEPVDTEQTQQHWLKQGDSLFLVYTRRGELSNGVFRSRAPLWIARVDPETVRLIRETERIVIPENGARMGNFAVESVTEDEVWVITGEWLEQFVPGMKDGDPFYVDCVNNNTRYNRIQYIGDLLLARIRFD